MYALASATGMLCDKLQNLSGRRELLSQAHWE